MARGDVRVVRAVPRPGRRDVLLAAGVAGAISLGTVLIAALRVLPGREIALAAVLALVACGIWGWHRVAPAVSASVVTAVVAAYVLAGLPYGPIQLAAALGAFAVARYRAAGPAAAVCAASAVVLACALWTRLDGSHVVATVSVLVAWPGVFVLVPGLGGALVRARDEAAARERADLLARGAAEERLRVAREIHDIAGHGFAVTAMQAGVALTVLDEDPAQARTSLLAIRASSEQALDELRATLEIMRGDPPRADDVVGLVERVRAAGLSVDLDVRGAPADVAPGLSETVYRVVQEALTNVVRHSDASSARVQLEYAADPVIARITDRGSGTAPVRDDGRGLAGLRDRIEATGGSLRAGNDPAGGFVVQASLPRVVPGVGP